MNAQFLNDAINLVDDDLISEAYFSAKRIKPFSAYKFFAIASTFLLVLTAVIIGVKGNNNPEAELTTVGSDQFGGDVSFSGICDNGIVYESSPYSDEEIMNFIEKNKEILAGNFALEYQIFDKPIKIAVKGYSPVYLGDSNKLILDNLILPVMIDDEIVGSVSLFKSDGKIRFTTAAHGETFARLTNALKDNPDSELAFFYVGLYKEFALTPDNKVYQITSPVSLPLEEDVDYYSEFKTEYNTYSWKILNDENNFISVDVSDLNSSSQTELTESKSFSNITKADNKNETSEVSDYYKNENIIGLDDVLTSEISSIEINSSTRMLQNQGSVTVDEDAKKEILNYLSLFESSEADDYNKGFGANYIVSLNYPDGSSAEIILMDKYFFISNADGNSMVYVEESGNIKNLIYYIVESL